MKCNEKCEVYSRVCGYFRPVSNWNKGKKEEFKERKTFKVTGTLTALAAALFLLAGCSHNTGAFTVGTRVNLGIDPQNVTANISYTDNGVKIESSTGNIQGIKRIRRDVGPQITGYLVDLSKSNPALAASYVEAVKYYWMYRADHP